MTSNFWTIWTTGGSALLVFILGVAVGYWLKWWTGRNQGEEVADAVRGIFSQLSMEALGAASEQLTAMARTQLAAERDMSAKELDHKKSMIDHELKAMGQTLEGLGNVVRGIESERKANFAELGQVLKSTQEKMRDLSDATGELKQVLSSSQSRGLWGERIADDILRFAGFVENINYEKQKAIASVGTKPDFTFFLPRKLVLNMDVKFPIANYSRFVGAANAMEKEAARKAFLNDVKLRIKEVTVRDYINPGQNTVDCVLMFIPHEQIYAFIQAEAPEVFDDALSKKVICCSPMTLFAVLAVVRQAVDSFAMEKASGEMLKVIGEFKSQWEKFTEKLEGLGKKISGIQGDYEALITTRRRQLEKPLEKLEEIRLSGVNKVAVLAPSDLELPAGIQHKE
ncbi:DNA recombination protein RmuC [bacterium]|nr:DNA recombination protein RmuC [bacterium]